MVREIEDLCLSTLNLTEVNVGHIQGLGKKTRRQLFVSILRRGTVLKVKPLQESSWAVNVRRKIKITGLNHETPYPFKV